MKKTLLAIFAVLLTVSVANARSMKMPTMTAKYEFAVMNQDLGIENYGAVGFTAELFDNHELVVHQTDLFVDQNPVTTTQSLKLSHATYQELIKTVSLLHDAELVEEYRNMVCKMMPPVTASMDHLYVVRASYAGVEGFYGPVKLVQNPKGCWMGYQVDVTPAFKSQAAKILKNQLKALALQAQ